MWINENLNQVAFETMWCDWMWKQIIDCAGSLITKYDDVRFVLGKQIRLAFLLVSIIHLYVAVLVSSLTKELLRNQHF